MAARAAYRYACETSIYLHRDRLGQGIGRVLLAELLEAAAACGFRQAVALIAGPGTASVALHARAGFVEVGRVKSAGRKHGRWIDVVTMQRALGEGDATPPEQEPR
jgi:phosphinothricin acetyltransferase